MKKSNSVVSRRSVLAGAAGVVAAPIVLKTSRAPAKSDSVTMMLFGGSYQDAMVKMVHDPFTKETGIKVNVVPWTGLDKVKAMQLTGNVAIDIWLDSSTSTASGSKQGFWEKLDPSIFDLQDMAIRPSSDYVGYEIYSQGITWNPAKYGLGKHPSTFAEFFDLQKFPGRRCLSKTPNPTMDLALLADGVAPADVYPLDLDRVFKSLGRIKSNTVWGATTTAMTSLVQAGEVDFSCANSNRVKATAEPGGGMPLAFSFEQVIIGVDCLAILKDAPNKENAMKLIAYLLRPEVQARFYNAVGLTPVSKKAATMLSPAVSKWQPQLNNPNNLILDADYWADHYEAANHRFLEWLLT